MAWLALPNNKIMRLICFVGQRKSTLKHVNIPENKHAAVIVQMPGLGVYAMGSQQATL
jgi:hypothetical protein